MDNKLLTAQELAEAMAVSLATIRRMTRDGQIPVVRVRCLVRYDLGQVVEALQQVGGGGRDVTEKMSWT
jgi:excisionase family DNA binding protein